MLRGMGGLVLPPGETRTNPRSEHPTDTGDGQGTGNQVIPKVT